MVSQNLQVRPKDFWLIIFPVFVFVSGDILLDVFSSWKISVVPNVANPSRIAEAANRYLFISTELAFVVACLGVFAYFLYDVGRTFCRSSRILIYGAYVLAGLLMTAVIWRPKLEGLPNRTYWLLGEDFFRKSLMGIEFLPFPNYNMYDIYNVVLRVMNVSAFIAVPALIVGCISTLGRTGDREGDQVDYGAALVLGYQADRLRTYLYLSSVVLILVVVQMIFWMQWPSFLLEESVKVQYDALVRSVSSYYGVNYALLACSYYIPVCLVLTRRMHNQAKVHLVHEGKELTVRSVRQWENRMGMVVVDLKSYKIMAAILSPLFPGLIGGLLNAFGGK